MSVVRRRTVVVIDDSCDGAVLVVLFLCLKHKQISTHIDIPYVFHSCVGGGVVVVSTSRSREKTGGKKT